LGAPGLDSFEVALGLETNDMGTKL